MRKRVRLLALLGIALIGLPDAARAAATIVIVNNDGAGAGFNDPTPAAPVGGNFGTTLGQQRLIAFQHAANIWGATLTSVQTIAIQTNFASGGSAVCWPGEAAGVGFGAPFSNFPGAPFANTNYVQALAEKLSGQNLGGVNPEFSMRTCLSASSYYLGLDNNHGSQVDLVNAFLHAMAHGLGFYNPTAASGGDFHLGMASVWDRFLLDTSTAKLWSQMTLAERQASLINFGHVVWTGANVAGAVPGVLTLGAALLEISGPEAGAAAGMQSASIATFGALPSPTPLTRALMPAFLANDGTGGACSALGTLDALAVQGNIALLERGGCADGVQALNVQLAGANAVILIDPSTSSPAPGPTGAAPGVSIPTVAIALPEGNALRTSLLHRGRRASGVTVALSRNASQYSGADTASRMIMNTPAISTQGAQHHWDPRATPNQLMEPGLGASLGHTVVPPADLTYRLLQDIGW